ncbi:Protein Daple [Coniochaeta hoffmannii]|uniref:Protein Daple n=1 Tax=Coniochaeta hoffmannii TaxID=91930 RepID=A0AA38RGB3_9PEZI|nr:Protein Daple [Coniochaeta hoffmannii]
MASHNHPNDYVKRHQSRIKREMYANRLNPFNSPPSSTGSHGTVSDTTGDLTQNLSNFSFNPDDEGTRKLAEVVNNSLPKRLAGNTGRFGTRPSTATNLNNIPNINTSALARSFPEWATGTVTTTSGDVNTQQPNFQTRPAAKPAVKFAPKPAPVTIDDDTKENIPPPSEDTVPLKYLISRRKTRAEMQPRVETPSETSTVLSRTPTQPLPPSRRSRFAKTASQAPKEKESCDKPLPFTGGHAQQEHSSSSPINRSGLTGGPSFLLPSFHHLSDLTSGTLKFSTLKNGVPVFVKHGNTRTQFEQPANQHDTIDAVDIPEEDHEIFVSMDKIREEVRELQEHDQMVQREAEKLQSEVNRLHIELKRLKQRKVSDSAFGSGSESEQSINRALDAQRNLYDEKIAQLQSRLEQASRQVGVNDIHSAALTAERDEALHQASQAREKVKRLQAEIEASQKDLESTERYRREKENLENENASLRSANDNLHERNLALSTEMGLKIAEINSVRQELASVNDELQQLKGLHQSLMEQKNMLAEDHASLERQNEYYFNENKSLRSKMDLDARRMADLEQSISRRDQLINELQNNMTQMTEPAAGREEYAELLSKVKKLTDQHATEHRTKDEVIRAKDNVIRSQNDQMTRLQEQLADGLIHQREFMEQQREIIKLKDEILELRRDEATWKREQIKNARMSRDQFTMQNDLENRRQQQQDWAEEKKSMEDQIHHLQSVLKSVREANKQVADLNLTSNTINLTEQSVRVTRVRTTSQSAKYAASENSAKSEALHADDDPTRQVNMTGQSDFLSVLTGNPVVELKDVTDQPQLRKQIIDHNAEEASAENTVQTVDSDLPTLPAPFHRRSKSEETLTLKQKQPASILKKSSKYAQDDNTTGALSVRSAHSAVSQASARSYRSGSENMTSAFIIPDITLENARRPSTDGRIAVPTRDGRTIMRKASKELLEGRKCQEQCEQSADALRQTLRATRSRSVSRQRQTSATLSREAVSVLDNICRHKTTNCTVCSRMAARTTTQPPMTATSEQPLKKRVTVERPVPVTDRSPQLTGEYTEEPTMRPSMPPGDALAIVLKELNDEARHLEMQMQAKMLELFKLDKATQGRRRKLLTVQYQDLQREYEGKTAQIYRLHDVLEGQKRAGQLMTQEEVDVTIASIRCGGVEATTTTQTVTRESASGRAAQGQDTWDGFDSASFD